MSRRPKIKITLIDRKGPVGCHRGHKIGDSYDFDTQRGELCPMAMHVAFPYVDILRYGGNIPGQHPKIHISHTDDRQPVAHPHPKKDSENHHHQDHIRKYLIHFVISIASHHKTL